MAPLEISGRTDSSNVMVMGTTEASQQHLAVLSLMSGSIGREWTLWPHRHIVPLSVVNGLLSSLIANYGRNVSYMTNWPQVMQTAALFLPLSQGSNYIDSLSAPLSTE
jgi:hypothetical protein